MNSMPNLEQIAQHFDVKTITIIVLVILYTRIIDFFKKKYRNKNKSNEK